MAQQEDIRYSLQVNGGTGFEVVKFSHTERISHCFKTELTLVSTDEKASFADILDNPATLTLWQGDEAVRYINGIVTDIAQGKTGFHRTYYTMTIEPALSRLKLGSDSRIFQNKDAVEIVSEVFTAYGIEHFKFLSLKQPKPVKREFCQQYRESHYQYIKRMLAEEGFMFFFEHQKDRHMLHIIDDSQAALPSQAALLYNPAPSGDSAEPRIHQVDFREKLAPTHQMMKDYCFTHPDYHQRHKSEGGKIANENKAYEMYDFPGRYKKDDQGKAFTQVRSEALRKETKTITTHGDDMRVISGYRMKLTEHPRAELNEEWTVIETNSEGYQPGVLEEEAPTGENGEQAGSYYKNTAMMVPWSVKWRAKTQHKPIVDGPQMATVVGPKGEEIYTDEWGRVKLRFHYDRYANSDDKDSCWIRVSQGWAGMGWGGVAIPRIGQEVIVDYLEGDPDQPIVTGRTYNANNLPPYSLPANKTRMTIKSKTHKGKGFNELRFEDEKGKQEVFVHAEKDQNNVVKNNETTQVGVDRSENVGNNETIGIGNDRQEQVGHDEAIAIGNNRQEQVGKNETIAIGKNRTETVGKNEKTTIGGNQIETIQKNKAETIAIAKALTVGAGYQVSVGAAKNETVGLSSTEQVGIMKHIVVGKRFELVVGGSSLVLNSDGTIVMKGKKIQIEAGDKTTVLGKWVEIN